MSRMIVPFVLLVMSGCSPEPLSPEDTGAGEGEVGGAALRRHCVVGASTIDEDENGDPVVQPPSRPTECFQQFSEAIAFATGGRVLLSADATPEDVTEAQLNGTRDLARLATAPLSPHVVAIEYADTNYGGASLTVHSAASCDAATVTVDVPANWNDVISSARVFAGCNHSYHYEHGGQRGAQVDCGRGCAYVGNALNDRTSSLKWTR